MGALAALSLLLGTVAAVSAGNVLPFPDEREYLALGTNLARHGVYSYDRMHPTAYRPPGYPVFLALLRLLGANVLALRIAGAVLLSVAVVLLYRLLRPALGLPVAVVTCGVTAGYPLLLYTATRLYPQALSLVLLLVVLVSARRATRPGRVRAPALLSGLCAGALVLTAPALGAALLACLAVMTVRHRQRIAGPALVLAAVGLLLLPAAWTLRNAARLHAFVPVSTNTGLNLLIGNNDRARADTGPNVDVTAFTDEVARRRLPEPAADRFYTTAALHWAREHPARALALYSEKAGYDFAWSNRLYAAGESSPARDFLAAACYLPFLALFVVRLVLAARHRWRLTPTEALLTGLVVVNALVQAVSTTRVRYRVPLDPLMIGVALTVLPLRWRARAWPVMRTPDAAVAPEA